MSTSLDSGDLASAKASLSNQLLVAGTGTEVTALAASSPAPSRNVVGVGVGYSTVAGQTTLEPAILVFVEKKFPPNVIAEEHLLPEEHEGHRVDVVEAGRFIRFSPNPMARFRPIQPGCSMGFQDPQNTETMAGTCGAIVAQGSNFLILSNNHVLADQNNLPVGAPIFQPGLLDGGSTSSDAVATLTQFVPLASSANKVDAAIAQIDPSIPYSSAVLGIGSFVGNRLASVGMAVQKFGRTTSYTSGSVLSTDTDLRISYGGTLGAILFTGQIVIQGSNNAAFSGAGDSGSLILDLPSSGAPAAVGLLFGGSPTMTVANHIGDVLAALNIQLT